MIILSIIPPILLSNIVDIFVRLSRANHRYSKVILTPTKKGVIILSLSSRT